MNRTGQASVRLELSDPGMVLVAQEQARQLARLAGMPVAGAEDAAVVAAELASNAVRHASGGQVWLVPVTGSPALDVVVADRGPGRADFAACFTDGYSSSPPSLGAGLGAVVRRSAAVASCSEVDRGTVVVARIGEVGQADPAGTGAVVGAVGSPRRREVVNGDAWGWASTPAWTTVVVADGLGHGPGAAAASAEALADVASLAALEPREALAVVHGRLRHTRGAAVTVARVQLPAAGRDGSLVVAGVGNVAAAVVDAQGAVSRLVIGHGTAGLSMRAPVQSARALHAGDRVVLHSDGVTGSWDLRGRSALVASAPAVLAGALLRDHERGTDDTAVVVVGAAPEAAR